MSWYDMLKNQIWDHNPLFPPPSDPMVRAAMEVSRGELHMASVDHENMAKVQDAVADWYAEHEAADHTDHVHVSPNVVAEALERQASERAASLDDLLAALDVDLLPWQRDCLGRWMEHKLTFRKR